ncbi:MAG: glutamate--tRNA ligase [Patescibacteria group bacterium]
MLENVITRFAPSPTGFLHLGSARTALYNFLFARKNNGKFILRIEDTDKERSKREFVDDIVENLKWLGLNFDEIVKQSDRSEIYKKVIEELLEKDKAYKCFCSKEKLEEKRQEQILKGEAPIYQGICRNLSKEEVDINRAKNIPYIIRLKITLQKITFVDLLRGEIDVVAEQLGDFVIAKSKTEPLFHLATPVDDHFMGITHIIRGADHISNASKQILIFKAMGWDIPVFAHIPLILGGEGGKLSKRQGAKSIGDYKVEGYLPEAINNFLVHLGWHSKTDKELFSLEEMIEEFDLKRVQKKAAVCNLNKLTWVNKFFIKKKLAGEIIDKINLTDFVIKEGDEYKAPNGIVYNKEQMLKIIELGKERANTLNDILKTASFFFKNFDYDKELLKWKSFSYEEIEISLEKIYKAFSELSDNTFTEEKLKEILDSLNSDKGLSYFPLRVALTGLSASPPPVEIVLIIGKEYTIKRIGRAIDKLK